MKLSGGRQTTDTTSYYQHIHALHRLLLHRETSPSSGFLCCFDTPQRNQNVTCCEVKCHVQNLVASKLENRVFPSRSPIFSIFVLPQYPHSSKEKKQENDDRRFFSRCGFPSLPPPSSP